MKQTDGFRVLVGFFTFLLSHSDGIGFMRFVGRLSQAGSVATIFPQTLKERFSCLPNMRWTATRSSHDYAVHRSFRRDLESIQNVYVACADVKTCPCPSVTMIYVPLGTETTLKKQVVVEFLGGDRYDSPQFWRVRQSEDGAL